MLAIVMGLPKNGQRMPQCDENSVILAWQVNVMTYPPILRALDSKKYVLHDIKAKKTSVSGCQHPKIPFFGQEMAKKYHRLTPYFEGHGLTGGLVS